MWIRGNIIIYVNQFSIKQRVLINPNAEFEQGSDYRERIRD